MTSWYRLASCAAVTGLLLAGCSGTAVTETPPPVSSTSAPADSPRIADLKIQFGGILADNLMKLSSAGKLQLCGAKDDNTKAFLRAFRNGGGFEELSDPQLIEIIRGQIDAFCS